MARYKAIPSRKEEFDAFWNGLLAECGCNSEEIGEIFSQSEEFLQKSLRLGQILYEEANVGRYEGETLEDFKKRKFLYLEMKAQAINDLAE